MMKRESPASEALQQGTKGNERAEHMGTPSVNPAAPGYNTNTERREGTGLGTCAWSQGPLFGFVLRPQ